MTGVVPSIRSKECFSLRRNVPNISIIRVEFENNKIFDPSAFHFFNIEANICIFPERDPSSPRVIISLILNKSFPIKKINTKGRKRNETTNQMQFFRSISHLQSLGFWYHLLVWKVPLMLNDYTFSVI